MKTYNKEAGKYYILKEDVTNDDMQVLNELALQLSAKQGYGFLVFEHIAVDLDFNEVKLWFDETGKDEKRWFNLSGAASEAIIDRIKEELEELENLEEIRLS